MRFVCGEPSAENQWREVEWGGGGWGVVERRNKLFVCMYSRCRYCIIDIIIKIIILISCRVGVSKLPGDGGFFRLVLL